MMCQSMDRKLSAAPLMHQFNSSSCGLGLIASRMAWRTLATALVAGALASCASAPQSPTTELDYKSRAVTRTDGGVRVSTAVLSTDESAAVYGVPLATKAIQPVWIEVENREEQAYFLLSPGLDPNFFPASEAAEALA
jgi:hypothetical protein